MYGQPVYYSSIIEAYDKEVHETAKVEFCGRDINFRFPNSDNGMHNLSFTLSNGEMLAIMGGSGTGKTTLLSLLNGTLKPQEGSITINGHDISEPEAKNLIGYVPQDDLLIEEQSFALVGGGAISRQIHLHLFWCSIGKNSIGLSAIQKIFINLQVLSSHGSASS